MRPYGKDHRHGPKLEGHQNCAICNEVKPPNKKRARRLNKKKIEEENTERILSAFGLDKSLNET